MAAGGAPALERALREWSGARVAGLYDLAEERRMLELVEERGQLILDHV